MGGKLFCSINLGSGEKFVLFVSLLEGAGDVYLFWPPKLGCGHHFFLPTSKYMNNYKLNFSNILHIRKILSTDITISI